MGLSLFILSGCGCWPTHDAPAIGGAAGTCTYGQFSTSDPA
jgi:hypothetical protein